MMIPPVGLLEGMRLPPEMFVLELELEPRLRCRECDPKGRAIVTIKWTESIGDE